MSRSVAVLTCALLLLLAPLAGAQEAKGDLAELFPLEGERRWIYLLTITVGEQSKTIEYVTRIARREKVEGLGECAVLESRSNDRLLNSEWFRLDPERGLINPKRQDDQAMATFKGRVLLTKADLAALAKGKKATPREWASASAKAKGTLHVAGRETIRLRKYGRLECLVVIDEGTYSFKEGKVVRKQERRLYFAPGIGLVKEVMTIKKPDGTTVMKTEAVLKHHEA